jgi:hypothetical protein
LAKFREEVERERIEKENTIRRMKQNEEQLERERMEKDREIAELKNQLSQASLLTSQVNTFYVFIHSSSSFSFHSAMRYSIHFARLLVI